MINFSFVEFYTRLQGIKNYHRRFPNELHQSLESEFVSFKKSDASVDKSAGAGGDLPNTHGLPQREGSMGGGDLNIIKDVNIDFTDEEGYGKYIDLNEIFIAYLNMPKLFPDKCDYLTFLGCFDEFEQMKDPRKKKSSEYEKYLGMILNYFKGYISRVKPLLNCEEVLQNCTRGLEQQWINGKFPKGWEWIGELTSSGIFCEACNKTFTKQSVFDAHLNGKKHKRNEANLASGASVGPRSESTEARMDEGAGEVAKTEDEKWALEMARTEAMIKCLVELVEEQRGATLVNVERKQARTAEELGKYL